MHKYKDKVFISLGSSCPTEADIEGLSSSKGLELDKMSGFFDWLIVSPQSVIEFFERYKAGTIYDDVSNKANYDEVHLNEFSVVYKNKLFSCMYVWHPETFRNNDDFTDITKHKLDNLFNTPGKKYFMLNNTNPQIVINMRLVKEDPKRFAITHYQYAKLTALLKDIFDGELILITNQAMSIGLPSHLYRSAFREDYFLDMINLES